LVAAVTVAHAALLEKWQEFLKSWSDIGMLTIMFMHQEDYLLNQLRMWWLPRPCLVAQIMLPILLLIYSRNTYQMPSVCPMRADGIAKAVAFAIGCIYQVRVVFMLESKSRELALLSSLARC
jgi:hypothetical protein